LHGRRPDPLHDGNQRPGDRREVHQAEPRAPPKVIALCPRPRGQRLCDPAPGGPFLWLHPSEDGLTLMVKKSEFIGSGPTFQTHNVEPIPE
jgi:hypothetical protein